MMYMPDLLKNIELFDENGNFRNPLEIAMEAYERLPQDMMDRFQSDPVIRELKLSAFYALIQQGVPVSMAANTVEDIALAVRLRADYQEEFQAYRKNLASAIMLIRAFASFEPTPDDDIPPFN